MSEILYIPPTGISFRLINYNSGYVIVSRNSDPQVLHYDPAKGTHDEQFFQLLHGTGGHSGEVAIRGNVTGKFLYVPADKDHSVYHTSGDGSAEYRFTLEPGSGKLANYFRLRDIATNQVIYSRRSPDPTFHNYNANKTRYDDQYWTYLFEDVEVVDVHYNLDAGKILSTTPIVVGNQTLKNETDEEQTMSLAINDTESQTSTFQYRVGFTVSVGMKFKAGIPLVADAGFSINTSLTNEWTMGESTTYTKSYIVTFPVKAGPHQTIKAVSTVSRGVLEVPFTMILKSKATGFQVTMDGIWSGISTWDLRHAISKVVEGDYY
ncbi:hemolytic lectin [Flammula alnicola]|nr:hemolytic lectin [Flammula alnicola]